MVYLISLIWRYWKLQRAIKKLNAAKNKTDSNQANQSPQWRQKFRRFCPPAWNRKVNNRCANLSVIIRRKRDNCRYWAIRHSFLQDYLKYCLGFVGGILWTTLNYFFMVYQLNFDEVTSIAMCVPLGIVLSFGLAFSNKCRCILFLALPQIFTGKGRALLLAYVLVLAHNGPFRNAMHNFQILVNSTVCLQEKVVVLLPPFVADSLKMNTGGMKQRLNETIAKFKSSFVAMEALYNETWDEVTKQYGWLASKRALCKKLRYRIQFFVHDLTSRLFQSWIVMLFSPWLPLLLQQIAKKCIAAGFAAACGYEEDEGLFFNTRKMMRQRMEAIRDYVVKEGDFKVAFAHHYSFNLSQSKSFKEVHTAIMVDVKSTFGWINTLIGIISTIFTGYLVLIFIKAIIYYRKYRKSPRYDNYYITNELRRLDDRRRDLGYSRLLPLRLRERLRYISIFSPTLVTKERKKFFRSFVLLFIAALNVSYFMALDYGLHWFSTVLCSYGGFIINIQGPTLPRLDIQGGGVLSHVFRGIVEAFDPLLNYYIPPIDLSSCMPKTRPPDYENYKRIGYLVLVCLLLTVVGSFGLRLRHVVAAIFIPEMKRHRAIHLHRKISVQRRFVDTFRHRRTHKRELIRSPMLLLALLFEYVTLSCPLIGRISRKLGFRSVFCSSCGNKILVEDLSTYKKCDNLGCKGIYCFKCFDHHLNNRCQICMKPIDYSEYTANLSEELDSSDEEMISAKTGIKIQNVNELGRNDNNSNARSSSDESSSNSDESDS